MCTERSSARHAADATIFRGNAIGDSYCCAAPPVPSFSTLCHLVRLGYVPPCKSFRALGLRRKSRDRGCVRRSSCSVDRVSIDKSRGEATVKRRRSRRIRNE